MYCRLWPNIDDNSTTDHESQQTTGYSGVHNDLFQKVENCPGVLRGVGTCFETCTGDGFRPGSAGAGVLPNGCGNVCFARGRLQLSRSPSRNCGNLFELLCRRRLRL
ncbi:hypothetical protein RvY_07364 [Ramazzottius varieornatus]|uniref:Uncharacterized protein n=1 Tax=Ramazzottius varieornatus TaxID=947166 RepID=A0A1D1V6X4_RAMVA|nr:hypothetical protein RvY_07364 [Ramazzottius varieornatus]